MAAIACPQTWVHAHELPACALRTVHQQAGNEHRSPKGSSRRVYGEERRVCIHGCVLDCILHLHATGRPGKGQWRPMTFKPRGSSRVLLLRLDPCLSLNHVKCHVQQGRREAGGLQSRDHALRQLLLQLLIIAPRIRATHGVPLKPNSLRQLPQDPPMPPPMPGSHSSDPRGTLR